MEMKSGCITAVANQSEAGDGVSTSKTQAGQTPPNTFHRTVTEVTSQSQVLPRVVTMTGSAALSLCSARVRARTHTAHICTHTHTHTHACIHARTHTHTRTHAHTHTHTHTHTPHTLRCPFLSNTFTSFCHFLSNSDILILIRFLHLF